MSLSAGRFLEGFSSTRAVGRLFSFDSWQKKESKQKKGQIKGRNDFLCK